MATNAEHYLGDLEAASKIIPAAKPYVMMNLMKFKASAQCPVTYKGPRAESSTGREAYIAYKNGFVRRAAELGVDLSIVFLGEAHTQLVAGPQEGENYDLVLLVRFPSFAAFRSVLEDKEYVNEIQPHRVSALEEIRSFAVTELADF
ncbi:hypothetical protein LTR10_018351 [Elasticomyces elasticus]|uniref:DUF1330 domain-containing protein n=1 Tax=Exophiala sideris TaxID=1016849 RepID=A0ABR0IZU1_9EURO|nr:hypothetical protein LTR10_018351 [Elasticomyces elasticus]KAK5023206.1 hypothetical protein LTS07_009428 [Exophiala sideris]KAK5028578.1 hypothetical protein LTR13_009029 [Exophiala sideris]KAK5052956.1 hypothetical protein LTR69_009525 [Exophiala sideris]KAK5178696.1 hypothetical protein LTR44_008810 [Eurotiomycetes sp. CCFEE 6388]